VRNVELSPGGSARITVVDEQGRAVSAVPLLFHSLPEEFPILDQICLTDRDGIFDLRGLRPGGYRVTAVHADGARVESEFHVRVGRRSEARVTLEEVQ